MFGKPEWFREKKIGWGVVPITWQGWGYSALWMLVLACPFMALLARGQAVESLIWLVAAMGTLLFDVRQILRAKTTPDDAEVLYIGDEESDGERLTTRNYKLQLRR